MSIKDLTVDTTTGRGIKVDDSFVAGWGGMPSESTTISVDGASFTTKDKKSAILVRSAKPIAITTAGTIDITGVPADTTHLVWVDEDAATNFGLVKLNEAQTDLVPEPIDDGYAATLSANGTWIDGYYKTLAAAVAAADSTDTVTLLKTVDESFSVAKELTVTRNGYSAEDAVAGEGYFRNVTAATYVTVTFVDDKVEPPEAQVLGKGMTATEPTPAPTFTGWTFQGWYTNLVAGEAWDFETPVEANITLNAKWAINQFNVIWVAEDGTVLETDENVEYGTKATFDGDAPTKADDTTALYTFLGWTNAVTTTATAAENLPEVTGPVTNAAAFKTWTKVAVPTAKTGLVYDGTAKTGVADSEDYTRSGDDTATAAGDYTATVTLADPDNTVWAGDTVAPTTATNKTVAWSIAPAPVTITVANASKKHGEDDPAFTGTVEGLVAEGDLGTVTYGRTNDTQAVGVYAGVIVPTYTANANYAVTVTPGTFTIESNLMTIIWVADGTETTNKVEWGTAVADFKPEDPSKSDASGKYAYLFAGWSPEVTPATNDATYVASFTQKIETPLALPLDPHTTDAAVDAAAWKVTVDLGPVGTIDGVTYTPSPAAAWDGDTATFSFSGLAWNQATNWSVSAQQGAGAFAETAYNEGAFYAKPKTSWFTATTNQLEAVADASDATVAYTNAVASNEGEMVRVHTKLAVPAVGLSAPPATGSAKVGFAVLQLDGDSTSAYYAYGNGTWTKLSGAKPTEGDHDYLAVYDLAAETPTARYYIDGVALSDTNGVYALKLAANVTSLKSISFASKEMVKDDIVAEQDVSYVAAVGETPYTDAEAAVTAQGKDPAKTMALLKQNVGIAPVSLAATTEKFVVDYTLGSFTNDSPAVSGVAGYDVKATPDGENAKHVTYALDPFVYPIDYVLALASATNAVANPTNYTVESAVAFLPAGAPGYTFEGWTNAAGAVVAGWSAGESLGAVTNYASWQLVTYDIAYTLNGGATDPADANPATYTVESPAIALANPTKQGYDFAGWTGTGLDAASTAVTIPTGSTGDRAYTATWTPALVNYTVKHLQQSVDGQSYVEVEGDSETLQGYTESQTEAVAKTYEGFQAGVFQQTEIKADGSTVVEIKYDRASFVLSIAYVTPAGVTAPNAYEGSFVYGASYSVESPSVTGYTPDIDVVAGTMPAAAVAANVTYTANKYTVTFVDEDGETVLKAATEYDYGTLAADISKPDDPAKAATAEKVYTFAGWTPAIETVTSNAVYKASYSEEDTVAAVITIADATTGATTTNYVASLAEAIDRANDGDTVQLLDDVEAPAIALDKDITLDFNGSTWTVVAGEGESEPGTIVVSGDVAIVDNSKNGGGAISSAADQVLVVDAADEEGATASVTIGENAAIVATGDDATALAVVDGTATVEGDVTGDIAVAADGALTVDGGTVTGDVAATGGDVTVADGTVDGTITAEGDTATVAVSGGEVDSVAVSDGAAVTVSDAGSVTGGVTADDATVTVTGGTVAGGVTAEGDSAVAVSGGSVTGDVTATDGADVTVSGNGSVAGDITSADGNVTVSGGSVTGDIASTGGEVAVSGGTVRGGVDATGGTVAVSGGSVTDGVDVSNGADVTVSDGSVAGGITAEDDGSSVTVSDDGAVTGGVTVSEGADVTISGGTVAGGVSAEDAGSEATITGGEIAGGVTVADGATGSVSGDDTVVNGTLTGTEETLVIDGGHFDNDPSAYVKEGYVAVADTPSGYKVQPGKSVIGTTITVAGGTYNGQAYEIGSVVLGDYTLTASDYTVVYTNVIDGVATNDNVNAGTVTATIAGIGEWIDTTNVTFTIAKAPLTITADNLTVPFRTPAADVEYTLSYSGFVNGETNTVFTAQATATSTYDDATAKAGDTFPITVSGAVAANYEITFVEGTLTVGAAEAPTILGTTSITVAQSTVTLQHVLQTGAKYYTYFTSTDLAKGEWVAAENSRAAESITPETVKDADGDEHEVATVEFTGVTDDVRFYQVGYSSVPYAIGDAMGEKPADGEEP